MNQYMRFLAPRFVGPTLAIGAAFLFGVSAPVAKLLADGMSAWLLAGLVYLGSGAGLAAWYLGRRFSGLRNNEATLKPADWPWMTAILFFGGVAAPVLLMFGLQSATASTASLLLNLEGLATMAIAWVVFREHVDRRLIFGAFAILAGAVVASWDFSAVVPSGGALLIAAACLCWGIDNNLMRKLSGADAVQIAMIKGLAAGATNTLLGFLTGASVPSLGVVALAGLIGVFGYGISLVLFVFALRELGAARTSAYFSTAPFIGALVAVLLFGEPLTVSLVGAAILMGIGVWLHLSERHEHWHEHEAMVHEHAHMHDEHHKHTHRSGDPLGEPHTHVHAHARLSHKHLHFPDLHHGHRH